MSDRWRSQTALIRTYLHIQYIRIAWRR